MLKDVSYNPDRLLVYHNREQVLKDIKKYSDQETYEAYRDAKVSDVFTKLDDGIYEFYDMNSPDIVMDPEFDAIESSYSDESYVHFPYGVCDDYKQILERDPFMHEIMKDDNHYIIVLTCVKRKLQPETCGWRWHKWGKYIGDFDPQHEYLYDEKGIDQVYVYQVYKIIKRYQN